MTGKTVSQQYGLAWMEIEHRAKDVAASDGVTFETAVDRVLQAEPRLYKLYLYEQHVERELASSHAVELADASPTITFPKQGRYASWADVEDRARELYRAGKFPSYEQALAHLLKTDHDAATIADLKSRGLIG